MLFKSGKIYMVKFQNENAKDNLRTRPAIVLENIGDDKVKIIPLSSRITNTKGEVTINILLNDRDSYVTLLTDKIMVLPKSALMTEIGSVSDNVMVKIRKMIFPSEEVSNPTDTEVQDNLSISEKYMKDMEDYIVDINKSVGKLISRKTAIMNIIVAIITGIMASLITNFIWLYITKTYNID